MEYFEGEDPTGQRYTIFVTHVLEKMGEGTFLFIHDDVGTRTSMLYKQDVVLDGTLDYSMICTYNDGIEDCMALHFTYSYGALIRTWEVYPWPDLDEHEQYSHDDNGIITEKRWPRCCTP